MNEFTVEHKKALVLSSIITAITAVGLAFFALQSDVFRQIIPPPAGEQGGSSEDLKAMEEAVSFDPPLVVEASQGANWAEL